MPNKPIVDLEEFTDLDSSSGICVKTLNNSLESPGWISLQNFEKYLLNKIYPIGSIYISTQNISPETILGGTWETFGQGRTLIGVDTNDSDFNMSLKEGGEKTHVLTLPETPVHSHNLLSSDGVAQTCRDLNTTSTVSRVIYSTSTGVDSSIGRMSSVGGNGAHNNLPPYITVYMFRRLA